MIRSVVWARVVYLSRRNPPNSLLLVFRITKSSSPQTMKSFVCAPSRQTSAVAVRVIDPFLRNALGCGLPLEMIRSQSNFSMRTSAFKTCDCAATKCRASNKPKASGSIAPYSWEKTNTVFFIASVVSTCVLSPVKCVAEKSPLNKTVTFRSRTSCVSPLRVTRKTLISALPYRFSPRMIAMFNCLDRLNIQTG